jgi:D-sedoheptulose 7-phosphate isomerase
MPGRSTPKQKGASAADGIIRRRLEEAARVKAALPDACARDLAQAVEAVLRALRAGRRVFLFGNGGSAADAQHIAAELEGRFYRNRPPLPVQALTTNTSLLTAVGNDLGFDEIFSRQVEAYVREGDVVIALSTSGRSPNVLKAVRAARERKAVVVAMTGGDGGPLKGLADIVLLAPSKDVARIQECHTTLGHILCETVEAASFGGP